MSELLRDCTVVIPSYGRAGAVKTLDWMPPAIMEHTMLAVRKREWKAYFNAYPDVPLIIVPNSSVGPAKTRQAICELVETPFLIQVDDDFKFFRRIPGKTNLLTATPEDVEEMFATLLESVQKYGHAGVSARGGNNHVAEKKKLVGRLAGIYGHNVSLLHEYGIRWDRLPVMEDFDVTLNLLRRGHPNEILYEFAFDQSMSNQAGGCSEYRTPELQQDGAFLLEEYHHPFVKAVRRQSNNWKGFEGKRWDVTVYWQKAFKSSDLA